MAASPSNSTIRCGVIGASAMRFQRKVEAGEQVVVGVNKYQADDDDANRPPVERPDAAAMQRGYSG